MEYNKKFNEVDLCFSTRIATLRTDLGISRAQLAEETGIAVASIGHYERGGRIPDMRVLWLLASRFGVSSDYLLGITDKPVAAEGWPACVCRGAVESVDKVKATVETMLKRAATPDIGPEPFSCYADIFMTLGDIDGIVFDAIADLREEYPAFGGFGREAEMEFDGKPLLLALAEGSDAAARFAKRLTAAVASIDTAVNKAKADVDGILVYRLKDALKGRAVHDYTQK